MRQRWGSVLAGLGLVALLASSGTAHAQIRNPGAHSHYDAEVEPHLVWQWDNTGWWADEGIGVGLRVTIPLVHNGPIETINNSMGIGFGLDWAHFGNACWVGGPFRQQIRGWDYGDCSMNDFWLPVVWQWNFFFSDSVSALFEPGLAIEHTRWSGSLCSGSGGSFCDYDNSDTSLRFVLWIGVRFHLSDDFALVLRLGTPSLQFGPSFLL